MENGKVKWFDSKKGFGFIKQENGDEIFVHYSGITTKGFRTLEEGQDVTFDITKGDKGNQASNVKIVGK